jgi:AmpD protein
MARTEGPDSDALWHRGWYRFARHCPSSNHGPRPSDCVIDLIVVHSISLPPGEFGGDQVQALFTNRLDWDAHPYFQQMRGLQVSAHFYIRRDGQLWQFVSCDDRAWHAGRSSHLGRDNCNDFSVGIELEGLEGGLFEDAQYESLAALMAALNDRHPVSHIVGHEHIAPGRKQDPGPGFNWRHLQRTLDWPASRLPPA